MTTTNWKQYKIIADALNLNYHKFIAKKLDNNENMYVEINKFKDFIENIHSNN